MRATAQLLKAATLSMALLGGVAVVATIAMPDTAYAGKGNGNGGGNGGGKGGGNGNGGDSGKGNSANAQGGGKSAEAKSSRGGGLSLKRIFGGKSESRTVRRSETQKQPRRTAVVQQKIEKSTSAPKPRGNRLAAALGVHPSELGALNAANASPQALANASPNSRVGKLAIYAEEVGAIQEMEAELAAAQELLDSMEAPENSVEEIDAAAAAKAAEKADLEAELAGLQAELESLDGSDPDLQAAIEEDIAAVTGAIGDADAELASLADERADAEAYAEAEAEVAQLEEDLAEQEDVARSALEAAANKEVTDEVEAAVQAMLGLDVDDAEIEEEVEQSPTE